MTCSLPAVHPATFPNSAEGFCMCRSSLNMESTHFNETYHLLKGKKILNLHCSGSICDYSDNCCGHSSSNVQLCSRSHTCFLTFFFFNPNLLSHIFMLLELKPHMNSLHSATYKLHALLPRFSLWLSPASCCMCQDLHYWVAPPLRVCFTAASWLLPVAAPLLGTTISRETEYHFLGLKLGEGHGRPWVQSLLCKCHWLTVQLEKVICALLHLSFPHL